MKIAGPILEHSLNFTEKAIHYFTKHSSETSANRISRRSLLKWGILSAVSVTFPHLTFSAVRTPQGTERSLSFFNIHTGESLKATYWVAGAYISEKLAEINSILRDYRTNEIQPINPKLLDFLYAIRIKLETENPFHIISGYRCPSTNALLYEQGRGVARNSLHKYGLAADVRLPGRQLLSLKQVALNLKGGGVGYYPKSDFVHIDVGRIRNW